MDENPDPPKEGPEPPKSDAPVKAPQIVNGVKTGKPDSDTALDEMKREMSAFETTILKWTRVNVGAVIATGLFVSLQWYEMRSGGNDTHKLAEAAFTQAQAMEIAANAQRAQAVSGIEALQKADAALNASIDASRLDQRAWVGIGQLTALPEPFHAGDNATITVSFKNTGKTPARNAVVVVIKDPVPTGRSPVFSYRGEKAARFGLQPPNLDSFVRMSVAKSRSTGEDRPLTPELLESLVSRRVILYLHGQIVYEDIFDRWHWVTFCYFLRNPEGAISFGACAEHNDTGDGQNPTYHPAVPAVAWPPAN